MCSRQTRGTLNGAASIRIALKDESGIAFRDGCVAASTNLHEANYRGSYLKKALISRKQF